MFKMYSKKNLENNKSEHTLSFQWQIVKGPMMLLEML